MNYCINVQYQNVRITAEFSISASLVITSLDLLMVRRRELCRQAPKNSILIRLEASWLTGKTI